MVSQNDILFSSCLTDCVSHENNRYSTDPEENVRDLRTHVAAETNTITKKATLWRLLGEDQRHI